MTQAKSEKVVQEIRRKTRRRFSTEEKIRIVLEGLRGEESIATLCRREGLNPNLYYRCVMGTTWLDSDTVAHWSFSRSAS